MAFSLGPFKIQLIDKLRSGFRVKYNLLLDKVINEGQAYTDGIKLITHDGSELTIDITEFFYSKEIIDETFFIDYATEEEAGKIRIATVEETLAGEDDLTAVTPYKLLQFWLAMQGRGVIAGEDLIAGDYVYLSSPNDPDEDEENVSMVARKAIATNNRTCAMGFVEYDAAEGEETFIRFSGQIDTFKETLVPGEYYYLSAVNPGAISRFPTQTPGTSQQIVGYAVSQLELLVEIHRPDKIWDPIFLNTFPEMYFEVGPGATNSINLLNYLQPYNLIPIDGQDEEVIQILDSGDLDVVTQDLGLAIYFSSAGSNEMKVRVIGNAPYSITAYNESDTQIYNTTSSSQEIEIPNSVVTALGNQTIKIVGMDADGKTATRTMAKVVRDRERIVHAFLSVADGNVSNHLAKINQGDGEHLTATSVIWGEIDTQAKLTTFLTSNYNGSGTDVEMDKIFALAETKTYAKRIKVGIQLGRQQDHLNNGSTITQFYGYEALIMRPGGTTPSSIPGFLTTLIPSPAHPQTRAYAKKLLRGAARRWGSKALAGTWAWAALIFTNTGEGEYPAFYKNAADGNDGESKGDFNPVNVALFKKRYPQYVNKDDNEIGGASSSSPLGLAWAEHHAVVLAEFEKEVFDDLYVAYPELRKCQFEGIDVGSAVDYLSHLRRTQNIQRRVRPTTGMIKMNDNPQNGGRLNFISGHASSLGFIYGGCTIAFEPSPTNPDFGDATSRSQVVTEVNDGMKPMAISWSFIDHDPGNVSYLLGATSFNQGQLRPGKQQYKTVSGNKVLQRIVRNVSDIFAFGAYDGWESVYNSFASSSGVAHPDTVSYDNLYTGTSGPVEPVPVDPDPEPGEPTDPGNGGGDYDPDNDDGNDPGGTPVTPPGGGEGSMSPGWGYRFLGLPAWVTTHTVVFDHMEIAGSPTVTGTWKAFLEVISQTRQRYLHEIVLNVYPQTTNEVVLLDTSGPTAVVIGPLPGVYPLPDKWDIGNTIRGRHDRWQMSLDGGGDDNSELDYKTVSDDVAERDLGKYQMLIDQDGIVTEAGQFRLFTTTSLRGSIVSRNNISFTLYDEEFESQIQFFLTKGGSQLGQILLQGTSSFINPQAYNIQYLIEDVEHDKAVVRITTKPGVAIFSRDIDLAGAETSGDYNLHLSDQAISEGGYTAFIDLYLADVLVTTRYADFVIDKKKTEAQGGLLKLVTKQANSTNLTTIDTLEESGNVNELPDDSWDILSNATSGPFDYQGFVLLQKKSTGLFDVDTQIHTGNPQFVQYPYAVTSSNFTIFGDFGSKDIGDIHQDETTFRVVVTRRLGGASGDVVAQYTADFSFGTLEDITDTPVAEPGSGIIDYLAGAGLLESTVDFIKTFRWNPDNSTLEINSGNQAQIKQKGVSYGHIQDIPTKTVIGRILSGTGASTAIPIVDLVTEGAEGIPSIEGLIDYLDTVLNSSVNGTPGFISKFGTAHTLANSVIRESAGLVGIGITPTQALHVLGNVLSTGQFQSTVSTGTSPLSIASTTLVANLHADFLNKSVLPGTGLTGGGPLTANVTLSLDTTYSDIRYMLSSAYALDWNDVNTNALSKFNTSSVNSPLSLVHGLYIGHGGNPNNPNYGTSIAFRNNRGFYRSIELGTWQPWLEIASREWVALNYVPLIRTITAGAGLSGGVQDLSLDRTITLGTPSTLSNATSNSSSGTTHTHAITSGDIVQGSNIVLSGSLTGRLLGSGNVTISATNIPWTIITGKPTTLSGFGILDGASLTDLSTGLATKENTLAKASLIQGSNIVLSGPLTNRLVGSGDVTISATNIPWTIISGRPTTLSGYGIIDAPTLTDLSTGLATKENTFPKGDLVQGSGIVLSGTLTNRLVGSGNVTISLGSVPWASITGIPTTRSGYGLTDVYTKSEVDSLIAGVPTGLSGSGTIYDVAIWDGGGNLTNTGRVLTVAGSQASVDGNLVIQPGSGYLAVSEMPSPSSPAKGMLWISIGGQLSFYNGTTNKVVVTL